MASRNRTRPFPPSSPPRRLALCAALLALAARAAGGDGEGDVDYGNHHSEWEDGPASWEEFGHDNDPGVCGLPRLTVEEWEAGRHWEGRVPVLVKNVTKGWAALENWRLQEMLRRYPDAEATMGEGRLVGETGPDDAGKNLSPTTVKEFITKHMYNPLKYFFDRKIAIPKGMLEDCHPFPMPTRAYLENPDAGSRYAPSKKKRVRSAPDRELWRDHLAISIGSDLQGLTFHHHREAWNIVVFGAKRWILWDHARWKGNGEMQWRLTRDWANDAHVSGAEWIRRLYPEPNRTREIREHGHDCIQHPGEMMFVPHRWMHMVVNIGDTVSVISEVGLGIGEGKKPEDFLYDPDESSDDGSEDSSEDGGREGSCSVCAGGLTVHQGTIIPYEEAEGASCGEMIEFALQHPESSRVCSQMKRAEKICCPRAGTDSRDSEDWDEYESEDNSEGSCSVCASGLTVPQGTIIPHEEAEGASCGEMMEFALQHSESSRVCSQMKGVEEICCPGAGTSSRDSEDWNDYEIEDDSEDIGYFSEA